MSDVSDSLRSLRSLTKNERPWVIRSGCSLKMSEHERIAQVAHQKWKNERANWSFFWANRSFAHIVAKSQRFAQKTDERIPNPGGQDLLAVLLILLVLHLDGGHWLWNSHRRSTIWASSMRSVSSIPARCGLMLKAALKKAVPSSPGEQNFNKEANTSDRTGNCRPPHAGTSLPSAPASADVPEPDAPSALCTYGSTTGGFSTRSMNARSMLKPIALSTCAKRSLSVVMSAISNQASGAWGQKLLSCTFPGLGAGAWCCCWSPGGPAVAATPLHHHWQPASPGKDSVNGTSSCFTGVTYGVYNDVGMDIFHSKFNWRIFALDSS